LQSRRLEEDLLATLGIPLLLENLLRFDGAPQALGPLVVGDGLGEGLRLPSDPDPLGGAPLGPVDALGA